MKRTLLKRKQPLRSKNGLSSTTTLSRKTRLKVKTDLKRAKTLVTKAQLHTSTPLRRKKLLGEGGATGLNRTSRLKANPETKATSKRWSEAVFAMFGSLCFLHRLRDPYSQVPAVHAAHIIKRSKMGAAIAYGPKDGPLEPRLGRPLCRNCHIRQEENLDPKYRFPLNLRIEAAQIHNSYADKKLKVPEE